LKGLTAFELFHPLQSLSTIFSHSKIWTEQSLQTLARKMSTWVFFLHIPTYLPGMSYIQIWIHCCYISCL